MNNKNKISRGTTRGMLKWYKKVPRCSVCARYHLINTEARTRGYCTTCFKAAIKIETLEWHLAGCFIQEARHPELFGVYEVFKDDKAQTHVGRYQTFNAAKKAARENPVPVPYQGAALLRGRRVKAK